jgi:hypothetical protein
MSERVKMRERRQKSFVPQLKKEEMNRNAK